MKPDKDSIQKVIDAFRLHSEELHLWEEGDGSLGCAIKLQDANPAHVQSLKTELERIGVGHVVIEIPDGPRYGGSYH